MADGSSSAAELEKAQGMKRSTSLQSNLSGHTHSSSSTSVGLVFGSKRKGGVAE